MFFTLRNTGSLKKKKKKKVMYCQVWWPILKIGALHLTHPSAHTQQWVVNTHTPWTHTQSSGQPLLQRPGSNWGFGALLKGTSVMVLKVERVLFIHNPHLQSLPVRESNQQPSGYKPNSLTARPQLPPNRRTNRRTVHCKVLWKPKIVLLRS